MNINSLVGKLNDTCRSKWEAALALCRAQANYYVEIEHLLVNLSSAQNTDLAHIMRCYGVDIARVNIDLTRILNDKQTGHREQPLPSPLLVKLLQQAWLLASVDFGVDKIRSGHFVLALLVDEELAQLVQGISPEFDKLSFKSLANNFHVVTGGSAEDPRATTEPVEATRLIQGRRVQERSVSVRGRSHAHVLAGSAMPACAPESGAHADDQLDVELSMLSHEFSYAPRGAHVVDEPVSGETLSTWADIPGQKLAAGATDVILNLKACLEQRVLGQEQALDVISKRLRMAYASLTPPHHPVGVFLLVGPNSVGKTETAAALADTLYGGPRNLLAFDLSHYREQPEGAGQDAMAALAAAVRRKSKAVVLLKNAETASGAVLDKFYEIFATGILEDGQGRSIDFRNTVIMLATNLGAQAIEQLCADGEARPDEKALLAAVAPDLAQTFKASLLRLMEVAVYYPLTDAVIRKIIRLQLNSIACRLAAAHGAEFSYDEALVITLAQLQRGNSNGERHIEKILTDRLLPEMARELLNRLAGGRSVARAHVKVSETGSFIFEIT